MAIKILLIYPGQVQDIERLALQKTPYIGAKSMFAPHALVAIAALTPDNFDVEIFDEAISGPVEDHLKNNQYSIAGLHLTTNLLQRCLDIGKYIRHDFPGIYLVAGGIGLANITKAQAGIFQSVFYGEAEETWPVFLNDFKNNASKPFYRKISRPDMEKVPVPRWELIAHNLKYYGVASVQTTRGCPFDCSFCNVIYTYGRKMRCKSVDQVLEEVKILERSGAITVFFADDNFAGNRKFTKDIVRQLIPLNNSFDAPLSFMTQLDITIADDDELLELLADCNFVELMIGIESVDPLSLKEMNKLQNLTINITDAVKKIQSYGILVFAHMIVGADNDTKETFEHTKRFFADTGITEYLLHPIMAPIGTKLWYSLKKDSRIINYEKIHDDFTDIVSNVIPKNMTRIELMEGMIEFWKDVNTIEANEDRAITFINNIKRIPQVRKPNFKGFRKMNKLVSATMRFYMFKAEKADRKIFFRLFKMAQRKNPLVIKRFILLYTNYLMNRERTLLYTKILKQQIEIERNSPSAIEVLSPETPVPESIIKHSQLLFTEAYKLIVAAVDTKKMAYNAIVETITDYSNSFGKELQEFDSQQKKNLQECADRVISSGGWKEESCNPMEHTKLPQEPPPGFFKQMLNSLDNNIRFSSAE